MPNGSTPSYSSSALASAGGTSNSSSSKRSKVSLTVNVTGSGGVKVAVPSNGPITIVNLGNSKNVAQANPPVSINNHPPLEPPNVQVANQHRYIQYPSGVQDNHANARTTPARQPAGQRPAVAHNVAPRQTVYPHSTGAHNGLSINFPMYPTARISTASDAAAKAEEKRREAVRRMKAQKKTEFDERAVKLFWREHHLKKEFDAQKLQTKELWERRALLLRDIEALAAERSALQL